MNVSDAISRRASVRAFLPEPVSITAMQKMLALAARAPSGGNLQPWHVHAVAGEPLRELLALVKARGPDLAAGYEIYPRDLWEPYRSRRFQNGEQLYASIGIGRENKADRLSQLAKNAELFGAPAGIFVFIDRGMGPPQWADLGMYLQNVMLLAVEQDLSTCPQEYWALYSNTVSEFLGVPPERMLFCGIAVGYADHSHPITRFRTDRAPLEEWMSLRGFQ
ncbi:nitroreductase [Bradyrhizobium liaoningense]|uniref:nitroreductase n=1 Tax=Bradyrhizobium liaoningense TaxID=43992 RepID=UPI001BAB3068|nr:nitroreductase [Bradyrhizobium liaoningense]MBR0905167.1 nitroreductase [Bradyrhizobium liaoningense]